MYLFGWYIFNCFLSGILKILLDTTDANTYYILVKFECERKRVCALIYITAMKITVLLYDE